MRTAVPAPLLLRVAAVAFALAAAWGPAATFAARVERVVVVDVSAGCDTDAVALAGLADGIGPGGALRLVAFGDGVAVGWDGAAVDGAAWRAAFASPGLPRGFPRPPPMASDLATALATAAELGADVEDAKLEVVVVGDGRATSSDVALASAAAALRRVGCSELSFVPLPSRAPGAHIARVRGPGRVRRGAVFGVGVDGDAGPRGAGVELVRDGIVLAARRVGAGRFRTVFPARAETSGEHVFEARLDGAAGQRDARAHVVVADPGRALLLADGETRGTLAAVIGAEVDVAPLDPERLEARLAAYDVVVVDAAPTPGAASAVEVWVRGGGGVVLLDGPDAVVRSGGPLAGAAPLRAVPPDAPGAFIYVAVDGSGSMAERWPGGTRTRDEVVRAAVGAALSQEPSDVTVALRRFDDRLRPDGAGPWTGRPARDAAALRRALDAWPAPGGGTALAPVLREAARLVGARTERARRALVFTDGRFADAPDDVVEAARALASADCGLTIVVDATEGHASLRRALDASLAEIVLVDDVVSLSAALRDATASRPNVVLHDVGLRLTAVGAEVPGMAVPRTASGVVRRWSAPDAVVWVETTDGVPVAALRRHGEGRIAALATRPADASYLTDGPAARALLAALRGWAERRANGDARIERDGDRLLVRATGIAPTQAEIPGDGGPRRVALHVAPGGLLQADLSSAEGGLVRLLDASGAEVWVAGLDRPGAPEHVREAAVDTARLARLAGGGPAPAGPPLRPWLAGLAVLCLGAAHVVAARRRSSPRGHLPI